VTDATRVAIALAWDYRSTRGEHAVGEGWLARARRLLEGVEPTDVHAWLALREASFALPGNPALARRRCAEAEALGRRLGDVDIEMTAVALDGLARVSEGEIAEGMARLDEATTAATAGEMRDPVAIGFSCCYLIFACERCATSSGPASGAAASSIWPRAGTSARCARFAGRTTGPC